MTWGERCDACGWCDAPGRCVWSVACPRCGAEPSRGCRGASARAEGLHQERWDASGTTWRVVTIGDYVDDPLELPEGTVAIVGDVHASQLIKLEDWEDLKRVEEFLDEVPSGVDLRVIDSLADLQRRILEEVAT